MDKGEKKKTGQQQHSKAQQQKYSYLQIAQIYTFYTKFTITQPNKINDKHSM